jgi:hypothetical protein
MSSPQDCPSPFLDPRFYNKPEEPVEEYLKKKNEKNQKNLNITNVPNPSKKDEKYKKDEKKEKKEIDQAQKKEDTPKKNDSVVDPNEIEIDIEEEARTQNVIETCLELLEKKQIEDEEDEQDQNEKQEEVVKNLENNEDLNVKNSNQHENHQTNLDLPPPPDGIYDTKDSLNDAIQAFAQAHGYAIVSKRGVPGKSVTFKCDRSVLFYHSNFISSRTIIIKTFNTLYFFLFFI